MRWVILAFLWLLFIVNFADKSIVGYATVPIMEDLGLTYAQMGLVGSSFYWLFSIAGVIGATWSDRIGTGKMLAIMAIAWTILQFSAFAIYGLPMLLLTRILLGAFEGPFYATVVSHLSKWFPPEKRGFAISLMNSGGTIGAFVIAPLLISIISDYGWRIAFGFLGFISLIWFVLWRWAGKQNPKDDIVTSEPVSVSRKVTWSEIYPLLLSRTNIFTCLAMFASFWVLTWITAWMPSYLVKVVHLTPAQMGNAAVIVGLGSLVVTISVSWFSDWLFKKTQSYRKARVFVAGLSLLLAALFLYSSTVIHVAAWAIAVFVVGKGLVYTMFVLGPQIVNSLLPERRGLMSGVLVGFGNLAGVISPLITGILVQSAGDNVMLGFHYSILFTASVLFVLGGVFLIFAKPDMQVKKNVLSKESKVAI